MKMKSDYLNAVAFVNDFGVEKIAKIQEAAAAVEVETCPFCGGDPELFLAHFPTPGCGIECSSCHCKTLIYHEGARIGSRTIETIADCLTEAVQTWNRRYNGKVDEKPVSRDSLAARVWRGME